MTCTALQESGSRQRDKDEGRLRTGHQLGKRGREEGVKNISTPWYTCMGKENSLYNWTKDNTKHVRISTVAWEVLKKQSIEEHKSMMVILNKLIIDSYGDEKL